MKDILFIKYEIGNFCIYYEKYCDRFRICKILDLPMKDTLYIQPIEIIEDKIKLLFPFNLNVNDTKIFNVNEKSISNIFTDLIEKDELGQWYKINFTVDNIPFSIEKIDDIPNIKN